MLEDDFLVSRNENTRLRASLEAIEERNDELKISWENLNEENAKKQEKLRREHPYQEGPGKQNFLLHPNNPPLEKRH